MKRCIYCKKNEPDIFFSNGRGDEVIPQFLGKFDWYFGDSAICSECNHNLGKVENIFKEGSLAGIHSAVWGINTQTSSIRIIKKRICWEIVGEEKEAGIFKNMFPFIKPNTREVESKPIVILDHPDSKIKYILFIEKYDYFFKKNISEYQKRKAHIDNIKNEFGKVDLIIFGNRKWPIGKIIKVLNQYGLSYNEKTKKQFAADTQKLIVSYKENGDKETLRTPAKIAFNYFSFCACQDHLEMSYFEPNRNVILGEIN